jgi:cation diffusion facilitator family transporter
MNPELTRVRGADRTGTGSITTSPHAPVEEIGVNETQIGVADVPPPPPPDDLYRFFRWMLVFLKASVRRGDRRPRQSTQTIASESIGTVIVAIGTDLAMLAAKAAAAALTGSAALFAETLHSAADTSNQLLLLYGLRKARSEPDLRHPFGYGAEVFYWALLSALSVFAVGGVLSIWQGVHHLIHPEELQANLVGYAVLGAGCLLDGISLLVSVRQLRREARARGVPFSHHLRSTTDTVVTAVYYEDSAALLGDLTALAGLGTHQVLRSSAPDAAAGIAIGLLLAGIGIRLAARNRDLLTNRSESPVVLDRIRDLLAADPEVADVGKVATLYVGPHRLLVMAEIQPIDSISGMRQRQLLAELRDRIKQAIPRAVAVFLMPVVAVEKPPALTPWDPDYWLRRFPESEQA